MIEEWKKELRVLLELIRAHPSSDWGKERERIALLNKLISSSALK